MHIQRLPLTIHADMTRVILRYWNMQDTNRLHGIVQRVKRMPEDEITRMWNSTQQLFANRHRDFEQHLIEHAGMACARLDRKSPAQESLLLLGAYLTMEYANSAAALFNPSIVQHPDQTGLESGMTRFILSLRAVGEGHISSIEFREGLIDGAFNVRLEPESAWRTTSSIRKIDDEKYIASFDPAMSLSERVLFPFEPDERNGMEDLRLVRFSDREKSEYYGTYTAYDGRQITSKILWTEDFQDFTISRMKGNVLQGKGIAIFPGKIKGKYAAIGRQDGQSMTIMYSDNIKQWDTASPLIGPHGPYGLVQVGNCGSPIETDAGWLLLTHEVGPMRRYMLGAALLDLEEPERVLHVLQEPLMEPLETERNGYVPNVLYTCGWMKHNQHILLPYAMSDTQCGFAIIRIDELIRELKLKG